ncbi:hypothetical protein GW17_00028583 [Ensete ventricosum]|nr:hypothetical protein GW17_00028583 [Ensete ventricosum]
MMGTRQSQRGGWRDYNGRITDEKSPSHGFELGLRLAKREERVGITVGLGSPMDLGPPLTWEERQCSLSRQRQAAPPNLHRSFALSSTRHPLASDLIEAFGRGRRRKKKRNNRNRSIVVDLEPALFRTRR